MGGWGDRGTRRREEAEMGREGDTEMGRWKISCRYPPGLKVLASPHLVTVSPNLRVSASPHLPLSAS